jgi:hypothetical protein
MLTLHADSHLDHNVPAEVVNYVLDRFKDKNGFFIETFDLPTYLPALECGLYGPTMGDGYIPEEAVEYTPRGNRPYASRLIDRPKRPTQQCTVIGGPYKGEPCVLYTVFGGPATPKEPGDFPDDMPVDARDDAILFWARHALAK